MRVDGTRSRTGPVTVTFLTDDFEGPPRVAYTVSRRVGAAVVRNRLRRRLRSIVAERTQHLLPGAYLIGVAPSVANMSYGELRSIVDKALEPMSTDRLSPTGRS
jgi:ribonuclease P protein component